MNNGIIFVSFALGAVGGAYVAWQIAKKKYEQFARDEIDSMREYYSLRKARAEKKEEMESETVTNHRAYADILNSEGYAEYENMTEEGGAETVKSDKPYIIPYEELGDKDYEIESLTYYADGILTDDWNNRIEDVEGTVGIDSLTHFGDDEDDADTVYVRNDRLKTDYEILRDDSKFADIIAGNPYDVEE